MQERKLNIRSLTQAGVYVLILAILIYSSTSIPLNLIVSFVLPIQLAYVYIKYDFKYFIIALISAFIISVLSMDIASAILFFIMMAIISTVLGYCMKNNIKTTITFAIISVICVLFGVLYFTVIIKVFMGIDYGTLLDSISKMFQSTLNDAKKMYIDNGMSQSQVNSLTDPLSEVLSKKYLESLTPSIIVMISVLYSYIECAIAIYFFKRIKLKVPSKIYFTKIHMHNLVVAFGIIGICIGVIMDNFNIAYGDVIYTTILIIGQGALLICGMSLVLNIFKNKTHVSNTLIVLIVIITLLFPVTAYGYTFLGLVDAFVNFRKISLNNINKK